MTVFDDSSLDNQRALASAEEPMSLDDLKRDAGFPKAM